MTPSTFESAPPREEIAVAWQDVRKVYDDGHVALDGVSLEVARGEFLAILGTSGSGKTTSPQTGQPAGRPDLGRRSGSMASRRRPGTRSSSGGRWGT